MRRTLPGLLLVLCALPAGCGDDARPQGPEPRVRLAVTLPQDGATVRARTVAVEGTVEPAAAQVQVLGDDVAVSDGRWRAEVPLEPGANLVDIAASATGRRPDFASLRIVLEERVRVPDLVGTDVETAQEQLEALGLDVAVEDGGGFFDPLLPGEPAVCSTEPTAGTQVLPRSAVLVVAARDC